VSYECPISHNTARRKLIQQFTEELQVEGADTRVQGASDPKVKHRPACTRAHLFHPQWFLPEMLGVIQLTGTALCCQWLLDNVRVCIRKSGEREGKNNRSTHQRQKLVVNHSCLQIIIFCSLSLSALFSLFSSLSVLWTKTTNVSVQDLPECSQQTQAQHRQAPKLRDF